MELREIWLVAFMGLAFIGLGIYAILSGVKGWYRNQRSKKLLGSLMRALLGEELFGKALIAFGIFLISAPILIGAIVIRASYGSPENPDNTQAIQTVITDEIIIRYNHPASGEITMYTTANKIRDKVEIIGEEEYTKYMAISFKNNNLTKIPDFVWKAKNLREIDLTNNNINSIPVDQLKSMTNIKKLVLDNNPVNIENVNRLKSMFDFEIVFSQLDTIR